ncbi:hypothetical protein FIBSPDRAFT_866427 [Athelia psychrophila]|uniref:Uncharacterized protein n=1 Tax=Athelia psychrophila TaxID=1759441 RepID=A0A166EPH1_9AGAM|nr:hypothetical protein FIBSPDRAFT_866427 [Fibularhizoctonia sp. CBS 109695]
MWLHVRSYVHDSPQVSSCDRGAVLSCVSKRLGKAAWGTELWRERFFTCGRHNYAPPVRRRSSCPREHDRREQQSQHRAPRPHVHNHCPFTYSHPYCPSPLFPEMESETGLERDAPHAIVDESVAPGAVAERRRSARDIDAARACPSLLICRWGWCAACPSRIPGRTCGRTPPRSVRLWEGRSRGIEVGTERR